MSDEEFLRICGAISGAITDFYGTRAIKHAKSYYEAIRRRKDDVERVAANTKYSTEQIAAVKNYVFIDEGVFTVIKGNSAYFTSRARYAGEVIRFTSRNLSRTFALLSLWHSIRLIRAADLFTYCSVSQRGLTTFTLTYELIT